jgi:adenylate cyclase
VTSPRRRKRLNRLAPLTGADGPAAYGVGVSEHTAVPASRATTGTGRALLLGLLALPILGLASLLVRPELDLSWEHHPSHFWLVLIGAAVNVVLAYVTNEAAGRRADTRLFLVSLAFLSSAGFLGLHALATPGVLLPNPNAGFVIATPVGLVIAAAFAASSVGPIAGTRGAALMRHAARLRLAVLAAMGAWAVVSLARLPPLNGPLPPAEAIGPVGGLAVIGVVLYALAAWRYWQLYRDRGSQVALAIAIALVLLAEAMVAVALSRNWHLSWWEWHALMTLAFAAIALGTRAEYRRTGSLSAAFGGIYLEATLARLDRWHARAIAELADAEERNASPEAAVARLRREGASADEIEVLREAARQLRQADELFRPYLPAQLADRLRDEPEIGRLGGEEREVSVLFADLAGFTSFSERHPPSEVITTLNEYWAAVVPVIDRHGGLIEHFAADGMLAVFNAVADQPDHAQRAADAALEIVRGTDPLAGAHPGWPRFRVGVNTGTAVVGNVGAAGRRTFGAIGDTANLGARLMSAGEPGQVVIGEATLRALADTELETTPLGRIPVKGKRDPVAAWVLHPPAT